MKKRYDFSKGRPNPHAKLLKNQVKPADEWPNDFLKCLGAWDEAIERPPAQPVTKLRKPSRH